jgi:phospholipase A1
LLNLGYVHQSNGRGTDFSRSWNRVYAQFGLEQRLRSDLQQALLVRPWVRVKENPAKDDNQDITDYYGYGDIVYVLKSPTATLTLTGRGNPSTRKGAAQIELSYRPDGIANYLGPLGFYFQAFTGYGESLIDYNWRQTTFGVGLSLNDIL